MDIDKVRSFLPSLLFVTSCRGRDSPIRQYCRVRTKKCEKGRVSTKYVLAAIWHYLQRSGFWYSTILSRKDDKIWERTCIEKERSVFLSLLFVTSCRGRESGIGDTVKKGRQNLRKDGYRESTSCLALAAFCH